MKAPINVYNISDATPYPSFKEVNAFIINGEKAILTDSDAVHTINDINKFFIINNSITISEFITKYAPIEKNIELGKWIRTFGGRIENNYKLLLESIKEIGLNPKDYPRNF